MTNIIYSTQNLSANQLKWLNHYKKLCIKSKERGLNKKKLDYYTEKHHITPEHFFVNRINAQSKPGWIIGNPNDKDNLVLLTLREHFIAHLLLVKIFPKSHQLKNALWIMGNKAKTTGKIYEFCRTQFINSAKSKNKANDEGRKAVGLKNSQRMSGQTKLTSPVVANRAEKMKGRTKETHSGVASQANKLTGRSRFTHSGVAQQAEKMKGRTKENYEYLERISASRTKINEIILREIVNLKKDNISAKNIKTHIQNEFNITISITAINRRFRQFTMENQ